MVQAHLYSQATWEATVSAHAHHPRRLFRSGIDFMIVISAIVVFGAVAIALITINSGRNDDVVPSFLVLMSTLVLLAAEWIGFFIAALLVFVAFINLLRGRWKLVIWLLLVAACLVALGYFFDFLVAIQGLYNPVLPRGNW